MHLARTYHTIPLYNLFTRGQGTASRGKIFGKIWEEGTERSETECIAEAGRAVEEDK